MTMDEVWAQLETDLAWRQDELRRLSNLQSAMKSDAQRSQFRRALIVMLYAHVEGFSKIALLTYINAVNNMTIACQNATNPLIAAAFTDIFHALTHGDPKQKVFSLPPHPDRKLAVLGRQREFIAELPRLLGQSLRIPDTTVNTEDNLSSHVVKRNLYRLGFPEDMLSGYYTDLDELVHRRNNIAHGADSTPVKDTDYERLRKSSFQAMDELALNVAAAVENGAFRRASLPATAP